MSPTGADASRPTTTDGLPRPTYNDVEKIVAGIDGASLGVIFAFRRAPDGCFSFPFASPVIEKLYGVSRRALTRDAAPVLRSIHPDDTKRVLTSVVESADKLTEWSCEFRINTPANGEMWLDGRAVPQREDDGSILWYGYVNGVTARKRAEFAVQQSEHKFHTYIENAPIPVLIVERDGRIVSSNPAAQQLLGYDFAALSYLTLFDLHLPEDRKEVRARLEALSTGGRVDGELRWVRSDGREVWVLLRAVRLEDGQSIGFCQDITERKRAELELKRSRELLEAFIDHAPVGIAMFNRNLRYIRTSRRWQAVMGASDAVLVGRHHYEDMPEMPATWIDAHQRGLAGETVKGEDDWLRPDGKLARHYWEVHPWGDAGVDSGGIIILFDDVTEARAMEVELRHAHKMEALGQLAGGVAHDFNNLLQIIQGYTEMLQHQVRGDETGTKYTGEVLKATKGASSLTRQLLAFSRKQVLTPAVVDLNEVVRTTSKMLKRLLSEDIDYRLDLVQPLWRVEADADQLSQVLINLCVDARDAMPGGGSLTITTRNQSVGDAGSSGYSKLHPGDYVVLTVQDSGTGMSAEVLEHIFEPFFTTKEMSKGTGLGLSTVYGIVRQSDGYVWAHSVPGEGTCVTVCLPRTSKPAVVAAAAFVGHQLRGTETVLLVEDDENVRNTVAEFLPTLGYKVMTAHPSHALATAAEHAGVIDLLITDVVMPEMSGPVLAERVRAVCPGLAVLFISGYIDDAVTRHGVLESKAPFLQKPFTLSEMAVAIREALARA